MAARKWRYKTHTVCHRCGTDELHEIDDGFIFCEDHGLQPVTPEACIAVARESLKRPIRINNQESKP